MKKYIVLISLITIFSCKREEVSQSGSHPMQLKKTVTIQLAKEIRLTIQ